VSHIYAPPPSPPRISPPYIFSQSSCTVIFISRIGPQPWPFYQNDLRRISYTVKFKVPVERKNGATIHRTAKEFAIDSLVCPRVVSISNSTLKGQTCGMLGKHSCLCCGQPLSVDLDHRISELIVRADRQLLSVCNIMLCQHLGVAWEEGAYSRENVRSRI